MKNWKKSWNLKSSKEYEPCYIFCTDKGKSVLSLNTKRYCWRRWSVGGGDCFQRLRFLCISTVFDHLTFVCLFVCLFFSVIKPRRIKVWAHGAGKSKSKDGKMFSSVFHTSSSRQLVWCSALKCLWLVLVFWVNCHCYGFQVFKFGDIYLSRLRHQ